MSNKSKRHTLPTGTLLITMLCIVTISMMGMVNANGVAGPTVTKTASPYNIAIAGSGTNDITTVAITVTGAGSTTTTSVPMDIVFAIDSSGSMTWNDPSNLRLQAAKDFIDRMDSSKDAAGVVSWDSSINFMAALTNNFGDAKSAVDSVDSSGGTDLTAGLSGAISILDANLRSEESAEVIIFLSDGDGSYSPSIADAAAAKGYTIYSIGLGSSVNVANLQDMSTRTGGTYYSAPTPENLGAIFNNIFTQVTTSTIPYYVDVIEVTQEYIVDEDSFNVAPDSVVTDSSGITTITWNNIGLISDGDPDLSDDENVLLSFNAKSDQSGSNLGVDVLGNAKVCYTDSNGIDIGCVDIPQAYINVNSPPIANPGEPYVGNEGSAITFDGSASSDPDGDALEYSWDLDNDGIFESSGVEVSKTWPDDYSGTVTLKVTDQFGVSHEASTTVTVNNVAPEVTLDTSYFVTVPITLRIAGQGMVGNSVAIEIVQDGTTIASDKIIREPGSPDEQEVTVSATLDLSKPYNGKLVFDTETAYSGGTPVWVIIDGVKTKITTFNTQKKDPSSYHQTYDFALDGIFTVIGKEITFTGTANDPGEDDLTFDWAFGDGEAFNMLYSWSGSHTVTDTVKHTYAAAGSYDVTLTVTDDDFGAGTISRTISVS